ncbi:MAG: hypothetical protein H6710_08115 [Myxococcales bacterium]|nr:hypothetical protein [Myxococcales bacterium]
MAPRQEDVGDLPHGDRPGANVAEPLVDGEFFLLADAEGVVELAARLEDVGDLPHGDRPGANVAEPLEGRKDFGLEDAEGLVDLAPRLEDAGYLTHGDRPGAQSAEPLEGRKDFGLEDAEGLVDLAPRPEDVGDLPHGDRPLVNVAEPLQDRKLCLQDSHGLGPLPSDHKQARKILQAFGALAFVPPCAVNCLVQESESTVAVARSKRPLSSDSKGLGRDRRCHSRLRQPGLGEAHELELGR